METPRRRTTVTSSLNEISTTSQRNKCQGTQTLLRCRQPFYSRFPVQRVIELGTPALQAWILSLDHRGWVSRTYIKRRREQFWIFVSCIHLFIVVGLGTTAVFVSAVRKKCYFSTPYSELERNYCSFNVFCKVTRKTQSALSAFCTGGTLSKNVQRISS